MNARRPSQEEFVRQWFIDRPDRDISSSEAKASIESIWFEQYGTRIEDSDRPIRRLAEKGILRKVKKGVYRLDSRAEEVQRNPGFSRIVTNSIFARDNFCCVECVSDDSVSNQTLFVSVARQSKGSASFGVLDGVTHCGKHHILASCETEPGMASDVVAMIAKEIKQKRGTSDPETKVMLSQILDLLNSNYPELLSAIAKRVK